MQGSADSLAPESFVVDGECWGTRDSDSDAGNANESSAARAMAVDAVGSSVAGASFIYRYILNESC